MEAKVYRENFEDWADVRSNFSLPDDEPEPERIFAVYDCPPYEGYATVVFERGGKWYLATGSHCSCYGLEGQWEPEEFDPSVHLAGLEQGKRLVAGYGFENDLFDDWLRANYPRS